MENGMCLQILDLNCSAAMLSRVVAEWSHVSHRCPSGHVQGPWGHHLLLHAASEAWGTGLGKAITEDQDSKQ